MEYSEEILEFISKTGKTIFDKGVTSGKSAGKDQSANEKDLVKIAESCAKLVDEAKIPDEKKIKGQFSKLLTDGLSREAILRVAKDCLVMAQSMPKPEPKAKTPKDEKEDK